MKHYTRKNVFRRLIQDGVFLGAIRRLAGNDRIAGRFAVSFAALRGSGRCWRFGGELHPALLTQQHTRARLSQMSSQVKTGRTLAAAALLIDETKRDSQFDSWR